jgi:hypothetical protein
MPRSVIIDMNVFNFWYQRNADMFQKKFSQVATECISKVTVQLDAGGYEHGAEQTPVVC